LIEDGVYTVDCVLEKGMWYYGE